MRQPPKPTCSRGHLIVDEQNLSSELGAMKGSLDTLALEVRDLRISVHGNQDLNIFGVEKRVTRLEECQAQRDVEMEKLKSERDAVKSWFKGATWTMGAVLAIVTIVGGWGVTTMLDMLREIMFRLP